MEGMAGVLRDLHADHSRPGWHARLVFIAAALRGRKGSTSLPINGTGVGREHRARPDGRRIHVERFRLRELKQLENEKFDMFVMRLREQAEKCDFSNIEEAMKDHVTAYCSSKELRKSILRRPGCTHEILRMARVEELIEAEDAEFRRERANTSVATTPASEVNRIQDRPKFNAKRNAQNRSYGRNQTRDSQPSECGRCGRKGHSGKDANCPAIHKKCLKCGATGHFAKKCFSKKRATSENKEEHTHSPAPKKMKSEETA